MLISGILFYLKCIETLSNLPIQNDRQRKMLATFLKTWLFYNSSSKSIFWTGLSSPEGIVDRVKEHRFSNLATITFILKNGLPNDNIRENILWIFERMQWNYTTVAENKRLSSFQQYEYFYNKLNGDIGALYRKANVDIKIFDAEANLFSTLQDFILNTSTFTVEISLDTKFIQKFLNGIIYAEDNIKINDNYRVMEIPKKGILIAAESYATLFKIILSGYLFCFKNTTTINQFRARYNYPDDRGPFRLMNNFTTQVSRVFSITRNNYTIYSSTYRGKEDMIRLLEIVSDYFDSQITYFDQDFNLLYETA